MGIPERMAGLVRIFGTVQNDPLPAIGCSADTLLISFEFDPRGAERGKNNGQQPKTDGKRRLQRTAELKDSSDHRKMNF